jgi:hypothetical protein
VDTWAPLMTRLIRALGRQSDVIGFVPSLLCAIAWVACGAAVAGAGAGALSQHPVLAEIFFVVLAGSVAIGGLVCFWILSMHIDFWIRGYQIRWLKGNEWVYEERRPRGPIERLPFSRIKLGDGDPAPCEVHIADEERWERQAPEWAKGRRAEILRRIAELSGANSGGRVQF